MWVRCVQCVGCGICGDDWGIQGGRYVKWGVKYVRRWEMTRGVYCMYIEKGGS